MSLAHIMTHEITSLPGGATAMDAVKYLHDMSVGSVVVADGENRPMGILTDRDLLFKVMLPGKDPAKVAVKDIMSAPVVTVSEDEDIMRVTELMKSHYVRRFPVTDKHDRVVGFVSLDDILIFLGEEMRNLAVALKKELRKDQPHKA
ncbi:MAG: CBS domain-containing protein [Nitrospirota bacterium]|jgi:CBS domain-containing protein